MPRYCLVDDESQTLEIVCSYDDLRKAVQPNGRIAWNGKLWDRDYGTELGLRRSGEVWRDHWSEGAAVHPKQIPEAMEFDRKHGVTVEYDGIGRPRFTSARQQMRYLRAHGIYNKDGGYTS